MTASLDMARKSQRQSQAQKTITTTNPSSKVKQTAKQGSAAVNEQATSVKQSLELVQTVVHASISTLLYLRQLFDEKCFDKQRYIISNKHLSYADYASGRQEDPLQPGDVPGKYLQIMRRNRSSRLNHLLDWLEHGAFKALQEGKLEALQLSIMENPDEPDNVLELFTFKFGDVKTNDGLVSEGTAVELGNVKSGKITNRNVSSKIQSFAQQIITLDYFAPRLPEFVGIQFHLILTSECSPSFDAPGFEPSDDYVVLFPDADNGIKSYNVPEIDAGFHQITLHAMHRNPDDDMDGSETPFPNQFLYGISHNRLHHITPEKQSSKLESPPKINQHNEVSQLVHEQDLKSAETSSTVSPSVKSDAHEYRERLQRMQQPLSAATQVEDTQLQNGVTQSAPPSARNPMILSPATIARLENERHVPKASSHRSQEINRQLDEVRCVCGSDNHDEDALIPCEFCGKWQHIYCHGFQSKDDPRLPLWPQSHVCYQCLLAGDENGLRTMKELAGMRRVIHAIEVHGYYNQKQLKDTLGHPMPQVSKIISKLIDVGYLVQPPGNRRQWSGKQWQVDKSAVLEKYFDPLSKIAHFYGTRHDPERDPSPTSNCAGMLANQNIFSTGSHPSTHPSSELPVIPSSENRKRKNEERNGNGEHLAKKRGNLLLSSAVVGSGLNAMTPPRAPSQGNPVQMHG